MSTLMAMRILLVAGEALAASALLMAIAWLGATQGAASRRHVVWCTAFGAALLLPLLALLSPSFVHFTLSAPVQAPLLPSTVDLIPVTDAPHDHVFEFNAAMLAEAAGYIWLLGAFAVLARALAGAFALLRLRAKSVMHRFGHLPIDGPRCELRLASEDDGRGPITWGVRRPVILLPKDALTWPRERLDAVLRHELAHVERRDCLAQLLALIVCALYWPNPLVWLGAQRLRREAEIAADDAVIVAGVRPSFYASELLQIARQFRGVPLSRLPLAMAAPSALEQRVRAVLAPAQSRRGVTAAEVIRIACLGVLATMALAFARPSLAQEAPKPVKPVMRLAAAMPVQVASDASPVIGVPPVDASPELPPVDSLPAIPAVPANAIIVDDSDGHMVRVVVSPKLNAQIHQQVRDALAQAHAAVEAARPQVERAIREAQTAQLNAQAEQHRVQALVRAQQPQIERAVRAAQAAQRNALVEQRRIQAIVRAQQPQIEAAVRVQQAQIEAAVRAQQPRIEAAVARMQRAIARAHANFDVRVDMEDGVPHSDDNDANVVEDRQDDTNVDESGDGSGSEPQE